LKESSIPNSFIAICGNHIDSSNVGEDYSYINLLTRQTGYQCLAKLSNAGLEEPSRTLQQQIDYYNPEIIVLQPDDMITRYSSIHIKLSFLQLVHLSMLSFFKNKSNKKYFTSIKTIIDNNPEKHFIILSPVPCNNKYQDKVKIMRGQEMKKIFSEANNTTYVNLLNSIKKKKRFFIESSYLNKFGHTLLARLIAKKSSLNFSTSQGKFAT